MNRIFCGDVFCYISDDDLEKLEYLHLAYKEIDFYERNSSNDNMTFKYDELDKEIDRIIEHLSKCGVHEIFFDEFSMIEIDDDWKRSYEREIKIDDILS